MTLLALSLSGLALYLLASSSLIQDARKQARIDAMAARIDAVIAGDGHEII